MEGGFGQILRLGPNNFESVFLFVRRGLDDDIECMLQKYNKYLKENIL